MSDRETLETDVLIVGGGPAGLATALRLVQLISQHNAAVASGSRAGPALSTEGICLLEKGRDIGSHLLSGAVMDPRALSELMAQEPEGNPRAEAPTACAVTHDEVRFLTRSGSWKLPVLPPFFHNDGNQLVSINRLGRWLGDKVERAGVTVFSGIAGRELLIEKDRVVGVRTDDKGIGRNGARKANFEPGINLRARVTILAEGSRGSLARQLLQDVPATMPERNPQVYALGVKELWEIPAGRVETGAVMHTAGYPLAQSQFGGGWLYAFPDRIVSVGLVAGLDYEDPGFDPHAAFQAYKAHPLIRGILKGGKLLKYGAKTIPEGGWYSLPPLSMSGALLVGDNAGFLNSQRLKGIHLAMKSGMLAAETVYEGLVNNNFSDAVLAGYAARVRRSWIYDELWPVRNYHQAMRMGLIRGGFHVALQMLTGGRGTQEMYPARAGHEHLKKRSSTALPAVQPVSPDSKLATDKLTDVFHSGTRHEENQPSHLRIADFDLCNNRCSREYGNPCQHFCPAAVYEMVETKGGRQLHLNPANCVHCKTCDIMDPYQIITWVPPEGGGGPGYESM